jgi:uncharacterized protein DUF6763
MNVSVGRPEIGQWYARADKGELFHVVGRDEASRTIEIQSFSGDLDEIEAEIWSALPLEKSAPPEDWTAPLDDIDPDDLGYTDTEMKASDWTRPLQPMRLDGEAWEEASPEDERDPLGAGVPAEAFSAELAETAERAR